MPHGPWPAATRGPRPRHAADEGPTIAAERARAHTGKPDRRLGDGRHEPRTTRTSDGTVATGSGSSARNVEPSELDAVGGHEAEGVTRLRVFFRAGLDRDVGLLEDVRRRPVQAHLHDHAPSSDDRRPGAARVDDGGGPRASRDEDVRRRNGATVDDDAGHPVAGLGEVRPGPDPDLDARAFGACGIRGVAAAGATG